MASVVQDFVEGEALDDLHEDDLPDRSPQRRCIATGQVFNKEDLLRFIISPDGILGPDFDHRLPGRGIWLSASRDVVNTALGKRLFAKAARRKVVVAEGLADQIEGLLLKRCLNVLGLARRAGQAISGFEKAKAELKSGRAALLVEAMDASAGQKGKIQGSGLKVPLVEVLMGSEMAVPFGRDNAVHVVMLPGGLANRFLGDARKLSGFREGNIQMPEPRKVKA